MKNIIVKILLVLTLIMLGVGIGTTAVLNAPKWVTEDGGLYIINTEFLGNIYEDVAEKESHMLTTHKYVAYTTERRK